MLLDVILKGVGAPALITVAFLLLLGRPRAPEDESPSWRDGDLPAWACAVAYVIAHGLLDGFDLSPHGATDWMPYVALGAAVASSVARRIPNAAAKIGVDLVFGVGVAWVIGAAIVKQREGAAGALLLAGSAASVVVVGRAFERVLRDRPAVLSTGLLALFVGAVAALAGASGTVRVAQLVGAAAASLGALAATSLVFRRPLFVEAAARVAAAIAVGGALLAFLYAELGPLPVALLGAAPLILVAVSLAVKSSRLRFAAQLLALLALAGTAGWRAAAPAPPPAADEGSGGSSGDDEYDYGYGYE